MDTRRIAAAVALVATAAVLVLVVARAAGPTGQTVEVDDPGPSERTIDYWTDERIRDAEPAPLPTVGD